MIQLKFCSTALTGLPVDMTVSQNGVKRALSVEAFGVPKASPVASDPNVKVTISAKRGQQQIAPEGIVFFATVEGFDSQPPAPGKVYDPQMHDIHYKWTFGDPGTYSAYERMLPDWNDRNVAYGPFPCHAFSAPGTYTVICTATERSSGKSASASYEVTVGDPNAIFTDATTICVDPNSDFTGAPTTTPANRVTTIIAARDRAVALGNAGQMSRILLRSGKTHPVTAQCHLGQLRNVYINVWGGTAKATLNAPEGVSGSILYYDRTTVSGGSISNLHFQGHWDAANTRQFQFKPMTGINAMNGFLAVHSCSADGVDTGYFAGTSSGRTLIVSNSSVSNWKNISMYGSAEVAPQSNTALALDSYIGLVGVRSTQNVQATQNGWKQDFTTPYEMDNDMGVIRVQLTGYLFIDGMEAFSRAGWSSDSSHKPADSTLIRDHRNDPRSKAFISRVFAEGGFSVIGSGDASGAAAKPCNTIYDKVFVGGVAMQTNGIGFTTSAVTARNVIVSRPNKGRGWGASYNMGIDVGSPALAISTPANKVEPVHVYNVTIVNELDATQDPTNWQAIRQTAGYFDEGYVKLQNNVIHRPNFAGGYTGDGPLDSTKLGIEPRYLGYKWHAVYNNDGSLKFAAQMPMNTAFANPPNPWSLWRPAVGSPARASASGDLVAYDDFLGNVRPAQASRGATEPV